MGKFLRDGDRTMEALIAEAKRSCSCVDGATPYGSLTCSGCGADRTFQVSRAELQTVYDERARSTNYNPMFSTFSKASVGFAGCFCLYGRRLRIKLTAETKPIQDVERGEGERA